MYLLLSVVTIVWQTPAPTDADLAHYEATVTRWRQHFINHYIDTSKTRGCFDNFHKVIHAAAQARRDGGFHTTCTSSHEQSHVPFAKRPARRHNRKGDVERRMLSLVQKSDQLNDANTRLETTETQADDSTSGSTTASGSVTRVNLRTGYMLYIYHKVLFSSCHLLQTLTYIASSLLFNYLRVALQRSSLENCRRHTSLSRRLNWLSCKHAHLKSGTVTSHRVTFALTIYLRAQCGGGTY